MEHEYRMKEIEIRNCDMGAGGDAETNPNNINNNPSRSAGMKALKLPPLNEDKDDLDAYLIRFERACTAFEVRQEHKSTQLARLLLDFELTYEGIQEMILRDQYFLTCDKSLQIFFKKRET